MLKTNTHARTHIFSAPCHCIRFGCDFGTMPTHFDCCNAHIYGFTWKYSITLLFLLLLLCEHRFSVWTLKDNNTIIIILYEITWNTKKRMIYSQQCNRAIVTSSLRWWFFTLNISVFCCCCCFCKTRSPFWEIDCRLSLNPVLCIVMYALYI